jgi:NitT/TauT family transport system permease protein
VSGAAHGVPRRLAAAVLPPVAVVAALVAAWEVAVRAVPLDAFVVPPPAAVWRTAIDMRADLAAAGLRTAARAAAGFAIAAAAGVLAGSVLGTSRFLMRGLYPIATLLQMVPLVAIAPMLVIWCGFGPRTAIASAAIVSVFPVLAATLDGIRSVDPGLVELFRVNRATRLARWRKLDLPWALPSIVTGLRIAAGLSVIGAIVGEFVGAFAGDRAPVGMLILSAMRETRPDVVFAAVGTAALAGFALFGAVSALGWLLLRRWHASEA